MKKRTTLIALFAVVLLLPLTAAAQTLTLQDSIPSTLVELLLPKDVAALNAGIATLQSSNDLDTKTTILLLIVLMTLLICIYPYRCSLIKFMKRVRGKFRKTERGTAPPTGGPTDGPTDDNTNTPPSTGEDGTTTGEDGKNNEQETQLEVAQRVLKDMEGLIAVIREKLGIAKSDKDETIITKLEAIIDSASKAIDNPSQEVSSSTTQSMDEAYNDLAGEIWSLADKSTNDDIKDKKTEALKDKDKHQQIVTFVEKLIEAYKDLQRAQKNAPTDGSKEITPEQLMQQVNWRKLTHWVIDQLSLKEYKKFNARKNTITKDVLFTEIADALKATTSEPTEDANSAANSQAKEADKLTEEQKKTVLQEVIDKINDKLSGQDQAEKTLNNNDIDTFIDEVVGGLSRPADISEAEATERKKNLELIKKVFERSLQDLDEKSVKDARDAWLLGKMNKKIDGLQADNLGRLYEILRAAMKDSDRLKDLLASYGATSKEELEKKIREKDYENLRKSVSKDLQALNLDKPVETAEQLVRALIKVAEDGQKDIQQVFEELKEKVKVYTHADATGSKATELVDEYSRCVQKREDELNKAIASKEQTINDNNKVISEKEDIIAKNKEEIEKKSERINDLLSDSTTMVDTLRSFAQQLSSLQSPLLDPCSNRDEGACAHANTTLTDAISTFTEQLTTFTVDGNTSPRETKQQIREMLTSFLTDPSSAVSILCRYYAYSNLPFMSDSQRKYGVLINVSAAHEQYTLIARLYATFSITLIVPALFAHGVATTPYTPLSGKASSALSFLCPQVVNHKDTMDTSVKPRDVVYDIVRVGYAIDEKIQAQPEVITF